MKTELGFILTSHYYDTHNGLELTYYCTNNHNPFVIKIQNERVVFFVDNDSKFNPDHIKFERKPGGLKSFAHKSVDTIYLNQYKDLQLAREYCETKGIRTYEVDVPPTERYLMERFVNGNIEIQGVPEEKNGLTTYLNPQIRKSSHAVSLSLISLDIETGSNGDLYSIALSYEKEGQRENLVLMMSNENRKVSNELTYFDNEKKLLESFIHTFNEYDPDLLIGWHVIGFDLMFLERKLVKYGLGFTIGRNNSKIKLDERRGAGFFANITGRIVLDGPPVLRNAFYQFKNFKLDTVASEVLGTGKDIASDAGKVNEIERRFKEDKEALAKYNILDCTLVTDIYLKLGIFDLMIKRVQISGLLMDRIGVSTAAFDHHFLPLLHRKGYIGPNRVDIIRDETTAGGLVIEPKAGLHKNVAIFDFKSLYPSIIRSFNIDPYSNIKSDTNPLKTPEGFEFSHTEHLLPSIIERLLEQREFAKQNNNKNLSQAIKILMNSFYGVMGSTRCRFYHSDLPTAITTTGHYILKATMQFFENRGHEVIYGDTDSIFVKLNESQVKDKDYCQELTNEIDIYIKRLLADEFQVTSYLECEFEKTFDQIFFSMSRGSNTAAKKRYAGYLDGEIEFKGMETVRSDWTELAKNFQRTIYEMYFQGEEMEQFIKKYIADLEEGKFDDLLVYTKRLSKAPEEYVKNIPIHVKAALKVNHTGPYRLKEVSYVITPSGPEPIQSNPTSYDYQHYIEKQIKPLADDILNSQGKHFDAIFTGSQLAFF